MTCLAQPPIAGSAHTVIGVHSDLFRGAVFILLLVGFVALILTVTTIERRTPTRQPDTDHHDSDHDEQ